MELDKETLKIIYETNRDVKHILKALNHGAEIFQNHTERIEGLEKSQHLMEGKFSVVTKLVVGIAATISGFAVYVWMSLINR